MKTGTKSLLFGVHQFIWHPVTVLLAWIWLYKRFPNWRELICIVVHDWGYWGKTNMDDEQGENHPYAGAKIAFFLFMDNEYYDLCLFHSRHLSRRLNREPSLLCWADKACIAFEPRWFYLLRARLSGELKEYRKISAETGFLPLTASNNEWFAWIKDRQVKLGREKRGNAVSYANTIREKDSKCSSAQ